MYSVTNSFIFSIMKASVRNCHFLSFGFATKLRKMLVHNQHLCICHKDTQYLTCTYFDVFNLS